MGISDFVKRVAKRSAGFQTGLSRGCARTGGKQPVAFNQALSRLQTGAPAFGANAAFDAFRKGAGTNRAADSISLEMKRASFAVQYYAMTRILLFSTLTLLLGCSAADDMPGYKKKSGDLGAFIVQQSSRFGARAQKTNDLPQFSADWRYKEDADGFQIYIAGDHFAQLQAFLSTAFGPPAEPPTTNEIAGTKSIGTYYGAQLGAALHYNWEMTRDGKQFTSMVVVRASALK